MNELALKVDIVSKMYDLSQVGTGTLYKDLNKLWAKILGKPDPYALIAELNDRTIKSDSGFVWALKDINFEVKKGEVLGIIGRNGAGKSTLLKLLSQITAPSFGSIKINGRIASLLEVGTGMHPEMTARENVYLNGAIMGMTRQEITKNLDEIIEFAGVSKYIDTPIKRFSSGMTVRLGFAVAAFLEPEILIVDEVLAVGDIEFQKKAIGKMQEVSQGQGRTVLFVSHNLASVEKLCSRAILLDNGTLKYSGSVSETIAFYQKANEEVANSKFLMNNHKLTYFKGVEIIKADDLSTNSLKIDEEFRVKLFINSTIKINLSFRITIFDLNDTRLFAFDSSYENIFFDIENGENIIICDIANGLELKPGSYFLNISAKKGSQVIDHVTRSLSFEVVTSDYYKTGKLPSIDTPIILKRSAWTKK